MGGEYNGPAAPESIVKCGVDVCKRPTLRIKITWKSTKGRLRQQKWM